MIARQKVDMSFHLISFPTISRIETQQSINDRIIQVTELSNQSNQNPILAELAAIPRIETIEKAPDLLVDLFNNRPKQEYLHSLPLETLVLTIQQHVKQCVQKINSDQVFLVNRLF